MTPFVWYIEEGRLLLGAEVVGYGYSGRAPFLNDPRHTDKIGQGPIPFGHWRIGVAKNHPSLGEWAIPLEPVSYTGKRSAFYIHGDNTRSDMSASRGCIVLTRQIRGYISARATEGHTALLVVA